MAVLYTLYKIRPNTMHPLYDALPVPYVPERVTRGALGTLICLLSAEPRSIARLIFPCQYLCITISVTPYSMMLDWRVSRAGPMPFYWPSCSLSFCLRLIYLSLISFYGLVLWGWGVRTDRVLIALSHHSIPNLFLK